MRDRVTLNRKEQSRAKVLTLVSERRCTTREAAQLLGLSERHLLRLKGACREEGPAALAHGNRGRRPVHAIAQAVRDQVVELATSLPVAGLQPHAPAGGAPRGARHNP